MGKSSGCHRSARFHKVRCGSCRVKVAVASTSEMDLNSAYFGVASRHNASSNTTLSVMASHDLPATGGSSEESIAKPAEQSQTASESVPGRPNSAQVPTDITRFIQSQLQLEADAREALPYVCLYSSVPYSLLTLAVAIRHMHQRSRPPPSKPLLLLDL